jgi:erythromycin esterase
MFAERLAEQARRLDTGRRYDFTALDTVAKSAQVIMLGEQSHGDGAAFRIKAEIVRYLHLTHNFNVLAFEADFYALATAWRAAATPAHVRERITPHIYGFWHRFRDTDALWTLVETRFQSSRPLIIAGLDPRYSGQLSSVDLLTALNGALTRYGAIGADDTDELSAFQVVLKELLEREYQQQVDAPAREMFLKTLERFRHRLGGVQGDDASFWSQELVNLSFCARNAWSFEGRDLGMAANLEWLAHKCYSGEKIIVWAHNFHVAKATNLIVRADGTYSDNPDGYPDTLLGEGASQKIANVYSLGLISGKGWHHPEAYSGNLTLRAQLETAPEGSLEARLVAKETTCAFVDLCTQPPNSFVMSGVTHSNSSAQNWSEAYDGLIFYRTPHGLTY